MNHIESDNQIALFQWAEYNQAKYPELKLLHSIPNGGKRSIVTAVMMKREGQKSGIPDIHLPVAKGKYFSLWVEMKAKGGRMSDHQKAWKESLELYGHKVVVCYDWEQARDTILRYLKGEE